MLPHYFEHFKNPVLRWVAIVCWVGARSSEISVFFCHLAKLICSNDNVTIVIPCCCRKKKERFCSCLLQISAGIIQSVPKKLCCVYTSANETEPVSRASPWQVPSTCSSQQVRLTAPWHFLGLCPNVSQGDFLCRRTKRFFTIRTKITSANEYENIFFQPGEVAIASDTSALTTKLMHCEEALGDHNSFSSMSPKHLCTLAYFFVICHASEHIPQCANSLLLPGLLLCRDARLKHQMAPIFLTWWVTTQSWQLVLAQALPLCLALHAFKVLNDRMPNKSLWNDFVLAQILRGACLLVIAGWDDENCTWV